MTNINDQFKQFLRENPVAINNLVTEDSTIAPQWLEVFKAGYQSGLEAVGDVLVPEDSEQVAKLQKEISVLKGQITKLKGKK